MKKITLLSAALVLASALTVGVSADASEAVRIEKHSGINTEWTADGSITFTGYSEKIGEHGDYAQGEYYKVPLDYSELTYTCDGEDLLYAENVRPELYMTWDTNMLYVGSIFEVEEFGSQSLTVSMGGTDYTVGYSEGEVLLPSATGVVGAASHDGNVIVTELAIPTETMEAGGTPEFSLSWSVGSAEDTVEIHKASGWKLSAVSYDGLCGTNLKWRLDNFGVLTIYGTGDMVDYSNSDSIKAPWRSYTVNKLIIEKGITHIAIRAFYKCYIGGDLVIPDGVESIGEGAFSYNNFTNSLVIPSSVTTIGTSAFASCKNFGSEVSFGRNVEAIEGMSFSFAKTVVSVVFTGDRPVISLGAFASCGSGFTIYYPADNESWSECEAIQDGVWTKFDGSNNCNAIAYNVTYGDIYDDGDVDIIDLMVLTRILTDWTFSDADKAKLNKYMSLAADLDLDGEITPADAIVLSRYLAGWDDYQTIPCQVSSQNTEE